MRTALLATGALTTLVLPAGSAVPAAPVDISPVVSRMTDPAAFRLLARSAQASRSERYEGTQVVAVYGGTGTQEYGGGAVTVFVHVQHWPGRGAVLRLQETAQSPAQEVFEPDGSTASSLGAGISPAVGRLSSRFSATITGAASVAGRPTTVVELRRPDGKPSARFWVDRASSLPLRREVFDRSGRLVRASAFVDVRVEDLPPADAPRVRAASLGRGEPVDPADVGGLQDAGWLTPTGLPGLELADARLDSAGDAPVLHLTYTDGLSAVSVFEQVGRLDTSSLQGWSLAQRAGRPVWVRPGVPERLTWSAQGRVFTVVSDFAGAGADELLSALPADAPRSAGGVVTRFRRGCGRLASWVNPFA